MPKPKKPLDIFCHRGTIRSPAEIHDVVKRFVQQSKGSQHAVLLTHEIYPFSKDRPTHREMKQHLDKIGDALKGRPNLRVVFSMQEKGVRDFPYVMAYSVGSDGYKMSPKKEMSAGDKSYFQEGRRKDSHRGDERKEHLARIWGKRARRMTRKGGEDLVDEVGGIKLLVRPCFDMVRSGKKNHVLLVPAYSGTASKLFLPRYAKESGAAIYLDGNLERWSGFWLDNLDEGTANLDHLNKPRVREALEGKGLNVRLLD
jgi:hypothetical protein